MNTSEHGLPNQVGLKPAEFDERDAWKIRTLVAFLGVCEAWALAFGSGILWILGLRYPIALGSAGVVASLILGVQTEQWLEIVSGKPIVNEDGEIASGPELWPVAYCLPPFIAALGGFFVPLGNRYVPITASVLSLAVIGWLMLRVWRV